MTRETRKIQKVGGSTFSVSLPKSWARARDLEAGSTVTVATHPDDVLVVDPADDEEPARRRVRVEHEDPDRPVHLVRAAYATGIDELVLEAPEALTREQRRAIASTADELPGTAVVEERQDRMVLRVLLDGGEVSIEQSIRQLAYVAAAAHSEAMAAVAGRSSADTVDRHDDVGRLFALVDRHVQRGLSRLVTGDAIDEPRPTLVDLQATARQLERVATDARRLRDGVDATEGSDPPTRLLTLGERAWTVVDVATRAILVDASEGADACEDVDACEDAARAALAEARTIETELASLTERSPAVSGDARYDRAIEYCRRTADRGSRIAELALRGSLRRDDLVVGPLDSEASIDRFGTDIRDGDAETDGSRRGVPAGADAVHGTTEGEDGLR